MRRALVAAALVGLATWCGVLYAYGVEALSDHDDHSGIVVSVAVLPFVVIALLVGAGRTLRRP